MKSKDLLRVVLTLTCNSFTTVVHIVRGVTPSDCGAQIRHMVYDYQYKPREKILVFLHAPNLSQPRQVACLCSCKYFIRVMHHF